MDWNNSILTTGHGNALINNFDVKMKNALIYENKFHEKEILNVKWSPDDKCLASSSTDSNVCIWKKGYKKPY